MRDDSVVPNLGTPPRDYEMHYFDSLVRKIEKYMQNTRSKGQIQVTTMDGTSITLSDTVTMSETTAPAAPAANNVVIYAEDNGAGKTRLMARFPTGAAQQIAIEP